MSRVVVVTGVARGIGATIAADFAAGGDVVVGLDLVASEAPIEGVRYMLADVGDSGAVARAFADLDRVDVLVNNAGIQRVGLVGRQPFEDWQDVIRTNLTGPYLCCMNAVPRMDRGAAIVSIASAAALVGLPGRGAYSAAKGGILALTRTMAVELAGRGVRANAVCPGFTRTAFVQQGIDDGSLDVDWMLQRVPLDRMGEPAEIARAVSFLASDASSYITGEALVVDGGWTVQGIGQAPDWLSAK